MRYLALSLMLLLTSCMSPKVITNLYQGNDAGYALISISAEEFVGVFSVSIRSVDNLSAKAVMSYDNGLWEKKPDFSQGDKSGRAELFRLKPGRYEIYYAQVSGAGGYSLPQEFRVLSFDVEKAGISYLGEFHFHDTKKGMGKSVWSSLDTDIDRDLRIAKNKGNFQVSDNIKDYTKIWDKP